MGGGAGGAGAAAVAGRGGGARDGKNKGTGMFFPPFFFIFSSLEEGEER